MYVLNKEAITPRYRNARRVTRIPRTASVTRRANITCVAEALRRKRFQAHSVAVTRVRRTTPTLSRSSR